MMTYEVFRDVVKEKLMEYLPDKYQGMKLDVYEVDKVNVALDGVTLIGGNAGISPTIYINHMYEDYLKTGDLKGTLQHAAMSIDVAMDNSPQIDTIDFKEAKNNIVFQLINTEQNGKLLENIPSRQFQDLSVIYRWVINIDENGIQSTIVNDDLARKLGMDEEQLFNAAAVNTKQILKPDVQCMDDIILQISAECPIPKEMIEFLRNEMPQEKQMWVIGNEKGINGAVTMLYEDVLHDLAKHLDSDLYIMPASIHETIAVSAEYYEPYELAEMVTDINMKEVSLEERLSNQVYHYDKDFRKLTMATDTPYKRLDGIVAEPELVYDTGSRGR